MLSGSGADVWAPTAVGPDILVLETAEEEREEEAEDGTSARDVVVRGEGEVDPALIPVNTGDELVEPPMATAGTEVEDGLVETMLLPVEDSPAGRAEEVVEEEDDDEKVARSTLKWGEPGQSRRAPATGTGTFSVLGESGAVTRRVIGGRGLVFADVA